jgi:peptide/nickel transport system permease protein
MLKYVLRRILYIIFVFFIVSIILFVVQQAIPGDPALMLVAGTEADFTHEEWVMHYQRAREMLGLDHPPHIQYLRWIGNILTGEFGFSSIYRRPVIDVVRTPMLNTVTMNVLNLIIVFAITIPIGIAAAVRRGRVFDQGVQVATTLGISMPTFLLCILVIWLFPITLGIGPMGGWGTPGFEGTPIQVLADRLRFMALPLLVMVLGSMAGLTRYVRAAMAEALTMDCVRTARSKGLMEKTVIYSHAFRNALIPIITVMTGWFITIFSGSVVVERMFSWQGMGDLFLTGLMNFDFAIAITMLLFFAFVSLVGLFLMDLAYGLADPRVRLK